MLCSVGSREARAHLLPRWGPRRGGRLFRELMELLRPGGLVPRGPIGAGVWAVVAKLRSPTNGLEVLHQAMGADPARTGRR